MQMSVFSVSFVFTQYKEKGVLKRLLATPMKPIQFVAANAITRLMVSVVQAFIFIGAGLLLFHVHIIGSYFLILLCVVLGALMFLGLGFSISGLAKTTDSVPAIGNLVVFPMLFLGGTFFAISNMPPWLQAIAKFLPLTYFSGALRDVMTKGAGLLDIKGDLFAMVIWSIILITLATITFRFQEKESA
jgi:ABC-2 type transport system permease protein